MLHYIPNTSYANSKFYLIMSIVSIPRTQSHTVQHSEPPVPSCRATQSINQSHLYTFSCKMYL